MIDPNATAILSPCGTYRYRLTRGPEPRLPIVMLNPSTADASQDDPTIRRCMGFARRQGYAGITVCNLFALRSKDPKALRPHKDPFGPENDLYLAELVRSAPPQREVLCAWGRHGHLFGADVHASLILHKAGAFLVCLGVTKEGLPRHPLMVAGDTPFEDWST
jgi:hypothetical protein